MRILLTAKFHQSGQTTHLVELARALGNMGHDVCVIALGRSLPLAVKACADMLHQHAIPCRHAVKSSQFFKMAEAFAPDIAHGHSSVAVPCLLRLRETHGVPCVITCHGLGVAGRFPDVAKVDRCIAVGPNVAQDLMKHSIASVIIQNGVDTERFSPGAKGPSLRIAYVGRVDETKRSGLNELIRATEAIPHAHLAVASNDRPVGPRLTALGWVDDVSKLLAESHIVCGTGRAIREGLACGAIGLVLGAKYGGPVTPDRYDGQAFPSFSGYDGVLPRSETIRTDILRLTQDAAFRGRLAAWSREFACRTFPIEKMAEAVVEVYRDAIRTWPS